MVEKISLLRDLLHQSADFVTDFLLLMQKFRELFGNKENGVENAETLEEVKAED